MRHLREELIKRIFTDSGLGAVSTIRRIDIGFSNAVYSVNDKYILKAGKSEPDDESLRREVYLCNLLREAVPSPEIIVADGSRTRHERFYIIYH